MAFVPAVPMIDLVFSLLRTVSQRSLPFTSRIAMTVSYVGVANIVPIPRYVAPPLAALRASLIVEHVTPIIESFPISFWAVSRSE